jgi:hypothetical protein
LELAILVCSTPHAYTNHTSVTSGRPAHFARKNNSRTWGLRFQGRFFFSPSSWSPYSSYYSASSFMLLCQNPILSTAQECWYRNFLTQFQWYFPTTGLKVTSNFSSYIEILQCIISFYTLLYIPYNQIPCVSFFRVSNYFCSFVLNCI